MSFLSKLKNFAATFLPGRVSGDGATEPPKTAPVKAPQTVKMFHTSKELLPVDPPLNEVLGADFLVKGGAGTSYRVGTNMMKRAADRMGKNNKERRMIRSRMKARVKELTAQKAAA